MNHLSVGTILTNEMYNQRLFLNSDTLRDQSDYYPKMHASYGTLAKLPH
jgi:hypothetical protein